MQTSTSTRLNGLLTAVIDGDMSHLLENVTSRNVNYADPRYRLTLLQWAVSLGRLPTTELLLARGASLLLVDGNGFTPLHRAVWCADVAVAFSLLFVSPPSRARAYRGSAAAADGGGAAGQRRGECGRQDADSEKEEAEDETAADGSASDGHAFTLWLNAQLNQRDGNPKSSSSSSSRGFHGKDRSKLSWRPGAQQLVDMPHPATGRTPLMLAAVRGASSLVVFLLDQCEADMYITDKDGYTAAELAALCGHVDLLTVFLARAQGDGTGRAFQRLQQHAEDYVLTARTVKQQQRLNEVNRRICEDIAAQSAILRV